MHDDGDRDEDYRVPDRTIRVWFADLRSLGGRLDALRALLSDDERDRAGRFAMEKLTNRFILRRGLLRALLGRCAGRAPEDLRFDYGSHGKPSLAGGPSFNLADSEDFVAIGVTPSGGIGVDIERLRMIESANDIAERFFHAGEHATLAALPPDRRDEGFLLAWTRKEAFIKAAGVGLSMPLDQFAVTVTPGGPVAVLSIDAALRAEVGAPEEWTLFDRRILPGTVAAVAARGSGWTVETRMVEDSLFDAPAVSARS
ncbi:4'-phosphopantetheinyl transferase family protein [Azospirillum doebereinerae]|uniref:4'-phosphopantetheinyl transferase superfamily protein n=1 Tax=Azospirillum doebereinerae TaxID=92933 RepID=A0A3S1CG87_9PROT|nr:4'-phosphopantetheinyl transferase superfamily protein [Azospirillum doebereinerae]MCG5240730.1 4'-phosphopantetheinyl transferase superfamily protein [Azospirillum doebereinerae]RUQ69246.1 4'-phosphopantetheinyl transferase superfamily protein [Azospirillum doebereinerae]